MRAVFIYFFISYMKDESLYSQYKEKNEHFATAFVESSAGIPGFSQYKNNYSLFLLIHILFSAVLFFAMWTKMCKRPQLLLELPCISV